MYSDALNQVLEKAKADPTNFTDRRLFKLIVGGNLGELSTTTLDPSWPTAKQQLLTAIQTTIEMEYGDKSAAELAKLSPKEFLTALEQTMDIDLSKTLLLTSLLKNASPSSSKSKKRPLIDLATPGESSGIRNPKMKAIATSSIDAYIMPVTADAQPCEDLNSSGEDLATLLNSVPSQVMNTGLTGSSIFYRNQGTSYTWKSPEWTSAHKFVDLKIYNNPSVLAEKKPMDWWREAGLRAKVLVGTPTSLPARTQRINDLLKKLTELLIAEANSQPKCVSLQKD